MVYIFCGPNWQALKAELDVCVSSFVTDHGDLALERIDCSESDVAAISNAIESLPFLATKKMVILNDCSKNTELIEDFQTILDKPDKSVDLVIVEGKLDKRGVYYKLLSKQPNFRAFEELNEQTATIWAKEYAKELGATLSRSDSEYFVQKVGLNQSMLASELDKLAAYNSVIDKSTIDLLASETPNSTIFNLVDAAFSGDIKRALRLYDEQRAQKVEPQSIHGMLVWQMHVVALCAAAGDATADEIARRSGMKPFVIQKSQRIARGMGKRQVGEFLTLLRDIDYKSKHQTYDYDEALRHAIMTLAV